MRRATNVLTASQVKHLREPGKHFDGFGLYLRVAENGSRQWVQRIVVAGRRRELGLGSPPVTSLASARSSALENFRMAREGLDPIAEKRRNKAILSFEQAARKVHELHKPTWRNAKHADDFLRSLEAYAFPKIGRVRAADVTSADVLAVLAPIWTDKPETARRVRQRMGTVLKWAKAQGWRIDNPAEDVGQALPKHDRTRQRRKSLPYVEVAGCLSSVKQSRAWDVTKLAIEFLVLTAGRSGEVRGATWNEIAGLDHPGSAAVWRIPADRMKAKREHRVPLSPRAVKILQLTAAYRDKSDLVFPSRSGKVLSDMTLSKLVKELGYDADIHGFRSSFRTWVQEKTDYPREIAEAALAHTIGNVEAAYARSDYIDRRRSLMRDWSNFIAGGANG